MVVSKQQMEALVGHAFPGGSYRIESWENFLLTEATGSDPLPDGLAHPVHLFHASIAGAGVSIGDLFGLAHADSDASVTIDYYDWEFLEPLRESEPYAVRGGITEHERKRGEHGQIVDSFTYRIEMLRKDGVAAARATFRWHFWRFGS